MQVRAFERYIPLKCVRNIYELIVSFPNTDK